MNTLAGIVPETMRMFPTPSGAETEYVCWSRMQAEAGQSLERIIERKELERQAGDGVFLWGVGNPPAIISSVLARAKIPVKVIFSVMKSKPKAIDVAPARTFAWRRYIDAHGKVQPLPASALITSRADSATGPKRSHYALMCRSGEPLRLQRGRFFDPEAYRNAGGTGARVGASQVTSLLRRIEDEAPDGDYEANLTACLTGSYWVRLVDPVILDQAAISRLSSIADISADQWCDFVRELTPAENGGQDTEALLL